MTDRTRWASGLGAAALLALALAGCDAGERVPLDEAIEVEPEAPAETLEVSPLVGLERDLDARILDAEQVLYGRVVALEHALSADDGPDTMVLPHTFVTFEVLTPIKGGAAGDLVTLRFLGGPWGDGTECISPDIPRFEVGEEVLAFAAHNGEYGCPLVGGRHGVVRLEGDDPTVEEAVGLVRDRAWAVHSRDELAAASVPSVDPATPFAIDAVRPVTPRFTAPTPIEEGEGR